MKEGQRERAKELTVKIEGQLVNAIDMRSGEVEEQHLQYKYRRFQRKGLTLLHYAALYDHEDMVDTLLKKGAGKQLERYVPQT